MTSTVNGKSKQVNVRLPLEWISLINTITDNTAEYIRSLVKQDLQRKGYLQPKRIDLAPLIGKQNEILSDLLDVTRSISDTLTSNALQENV